SSKKYLVLVFDQPFASVTTWEGKEKKVGQLHIKGDHTGAIVGPKVKDKSKPVQVMFASSIISAEQALLNLNELGNKTFDQIKEDGRQIWNTSLGKIKVEGDDIDQLRTFCSTMYRTLFFPNKLYEIDAAGKVVHYSPYN